MKVLTLSAAAFVALAAGVHAQPPAPLDLQIVFSGTDVDAINGASTNAEFDGVAVSSSEDFIYLLDSISTADALFVFNGTLPVTVYATEAQLDPTSPSVSAGDLDADATNVYTSIFDSTRQRIWRSPHTGFGTAVEMVDSTLCVGLDEIEVDAAGSRLILNYNDAFSPPPPNENLVTVPLNATTAIPTVVATEAAQEVALATITGYVDDTNDDVNVFDMTVQNDGDIIASHGFSSNRQINGSLLRITSAGAVSVFRTADQIITSAGGNPATLDIGSVNVEALSQDEILIDVRFTSDTAQLDQFIAVVSANGTTQTALTNNTQLSADSSVTPALVPAGQSLAHSNTVLPLNSTLDGKGGDVSGDDDYYFYRQSAATGVAAQNAVLRLTGIRSYLAPGAPTSVDGFETYR